MKEEKCYIYVLIEKEKPIYIGKTNNISRRLSHHKWKSNKIQLKIEEIDYVNIGEWKFWEKHYISLFRSWGFDLKNKNNGGGGLTKHNKESIEKSREKRKGQKRPSTSEKLKGKPINKETKQKISKANKGKPKPEGFGLKISNKKKNQKQSPESNYKRRIKHLGIPKPGVSKAHKGRTSPNKGHLGKNRSEKFKLENSINKSKPVLQFDLEGNFIKKYKSQTEAAITINKPKGSAAINECCHGKRKTAYGYIWKIN